jgi:glycerophosphoryl diester phosphodiesterase
MNLNSKYTKYIELDLQLTKDNRLVCIHDPLINNKYFNELQKKFPEKDFCYDETLIKFLEENQQIIIITDFKTDNLTGLQFIKNNFKQFSKRFIPQIYNEDEYLPVKNLGYKEIIFTLYRVGSYSNAKIVKIIENFDLFGLTMDPPRLRSGIADKIQNKNFLIYVHTVNSYLRFLQYKIFFGADEIYTDNLF